MTTRKNTVAARAGNEALHDRAAEAPVAEIAPAHVLLPEGVKELAAGDLLVICARPGFKRAGIEHERMRVYRDGELTPRQIGQMRREPKLTLVEVG